MFGLRYIKIQPTTYVLQYTKGKIVREGAGMSFYYFGPSTSIVAIPMASTDEPFIFEEQTRDYQAITLQGQITYRITDPKKLAGLMNFTLAANGVNYVSDDPEKLPQRVVNLLHVHARAEIEKLPLREALRASESLVVTLRRQLTEAPELIALGLEVLGLSILAIKPTPDTARALEAETREILLRQADEAIATRRNAAVEQERAIRENELQTEVAVETKKRQIRETQLDAERAVQEKQAEMEKARLTAGISLEDQRKQLVSLASENARAEADARAYGIAKTMEALASAPTQTLQALASSGMKPEQLIAFAFQELAGKAEKIGQLNISPDLLRELLDKPSKR